MPAPIIVAAVGKAFTQIVDFMKEAFAREADMGTCMLKVQNLGTSFPIDPSSLLDVTVNGIINPNDTKKMMELFGFKCQVYDNNFFQHTITEVDVKESIICRRLIRTQFNAANFEKTIDFQAFQMQEGFTLEQVLALRNRNVINDDMALWYLHRLGYRDYGTRDAALSLRYEVPGIADLIRFAVRDAFNPAVVKKFGYAEEYPTILNKYIDWQGYGWPTGFPRVGVAAQDDRPLPIEGRQAQLKGVANIQDLINNPPAIFQQQVKAPPVEKEVEDRCGRIGDATWGEIAWYAHWELPSPTQGYDMVHMLYPDSRFGPSPYVLKEDGTIDKSKVFISEDLGLLLKTADYPVFWRKRMEAISYPPLTRVDVRRMYDLGLISEQDVYHNYRAQGYDDRNAEMLMRFTVAKERLDIRKEICQSWELGLITEEEGRATLKKSELPERDIESFMTKCKLDWNIKKTKDIVGRTRKAVIEGVIDTAEARGLLANIGIQGIKIEAYIADWSLQISFEERLPTLSMLTDWYVNGLISRDDLIGRLQRLRYSDKDITRILKSMEDRRVRTQSAIESKARKDMENEEKKREKAIDAARKRAEAQRTQAEKAAKERVKQLEAEERERQNVLSEEEEELQQQLEEEDKRISEYNSRINKASTDKNLVAWHKSGVISIPQIKQRLKIRGFFEDDIERWVDTYIGGNGNAERTEEENQ